MAIRTRSQCICELRGVALLGENTGGVRAWDLKGFGV